MTLYRKALLNLAVVLVLAAVAVWAVAQLVVVRGFDAIEHADAEQHLQRAFAALENRLADADRFARDWGSWDDAYRYVEERGKEFERSNLDGAALVASDVEIVAFCDAKGNCVAGRRRNGRNDPYAPLERASLADLVGPTLAGGPPVARKGVALAGGRPLLVAARPILPSSEIGAPKGWLVMARPFDRETVHGLTRDLLLDLHVESLDAPDAAVPRAALGRGDKTAVEAANDDALLVHGILKDIEGRPALALGVEIDRTIHRRGVATARLMLVSLALVGALIGIVVLHRIAGEVARRVETMERRLAAIAAGGDFSGRLDVGGERDELDHLAEGVNGTLAALQRARDAQAANERAYRELVQTASQAIIIVEEGKIVFANAMAEEMGGIPAAELVGASAFSRVHPQDRGMVQERYAALVAGRGSAGPLECRLLDASGTVKWIHLTSTPVAWRGAPAISCIAVDVSAERRAQEDLSRAKDAAEAASRMKSLFVSTVSHEIRTPLNCIVGFAELAARASSLEEARGTSRTILKESETLLALINGLLDHAKIEAGRMELDPRAADLRAWLADIAAGTRTRAAAKGLEFWIEVGPNVPRFVVFDALRLRQVLQNLLSNALKFTRAGWVGVSVAIVERTPREVSLRFAVQDTGIGIPRNKQATIFESFAQADGGTTRRYGGTGLGTTIARRLVELMGGTMSLESEEGKGSTFSFVVSFPTAEAAAAEEEAPASAAAPAGGRRGRALLIEDYEPNQELARAHLEADGWTVDAADGGAIGVEAACATAYDLILMDVSMPDMDGCEATRRIRREGASRGAPIVAVTAHAGEDVRRRCLAAGMNDIIAKPIRRDSFLAACARWAGAAAASSPRLSPSAPAGRTSASATRPAPSAAGGPTSSPAPAEDAPAGGPPEAGAPAGDAPLAWDRGVSEFGGDEALFSRIQRQFLTRSADDVAAIEASAAAGDRDAARAVAHRLRGGALNLGADALGEAARLVEEAADDPAASLPPPAARLREERGRLLHWAEDRLHRG
ncbi:MAG: ATP-binding protein [Candidatus Polarisedimenticolia bacterium]